MRWRLWMVLVVTVLWASDVRVVQGGLNVWTPLGPDDGPINALAIDPITPTTLYAGSFVSGVFKSTDGGQHWTELIRLCVFALAIDPATPTTLYAGTCGGVFKSTDAGGSWSAARTGLPSAGVLALAIDPSTPTTLYAGTGLGVFKSTDAGGSWSAARTGLPLTGVDTLAIDPATPTTVYAGTSDYSGLFKSTNGGASWSAINIGLTHAPVGALAIDPTTPTTLYAGTFGDGVFTSPDGGGSWHALNTGLTFPFVEALALRPPILYAGTAGTRTAELEHGDVFAITFVDSCRDMGSSLLWGTITDIGGRRGVPDVTVTLDGPSECTDLVTTGALRLFLFSTLGDGSYTLSPSKPGCTFSPPSADATIAGNNPRINLIATCP